MYRLFLSVSTIALAVSAGSALAQIGQIDTPTEVIVTGTRATGVKAADSAAPIELIGSQALQRTGAASLSDSLLAAVPSLNVQHNGGDAAAVISIAALRGVSPNDTLVLVDGKRRHTTSTLYVDGGAGGSFIGAATVDLSFIPVGAIDHVEVLTDGAAAQYGSDAIAGVVNIILKSSAHSGVASLTGGQYNEGDGKTGSWYINKGIRLTDKGFLNVTVEEQYHDFSEQGVGDRRVTTPSGQPLATDDAFTAAGIQKADNYPGLNRLNGDPKYNLYNGFFNSGYDITPNLKFYAFGNYSQRVSSHFENYRLPEKVTGITSTGVTVYPFPTGFDPREKFDETDYSLTAGLKGNFAGWNWDVSSTYGRDESQIHVIDSANAVLYSVLQGLSATPIIPQRNFYNGGYISSELTNTLDIDRSIPVAWAASPLNFAIGAEQRYDTYRLLAGEPSSYYGSGSESFDGYTPLDAAGHSRTNYAFYVDLAIDPIAHLHTDLAVRYENYSDFGGTTVGKFTARYDVNSWIAVRGTVSTGFRAPTLAEEFFSGTDVAPTGADVRLPSNSDAAKVAGFSPLKPEQSDNYSLGIVLHPLPKLQITADAYSILIKDRILDSGFLLGSVGGYGTVAQGVLNAIAARGITLAPGLSYSGITVFRNAANTRTNGVEVTATYSSDFEEYGHVDWSLGFNYNKTEATKLYPLPADVVNDDFGQTAIPGNLSSLLTETPREKAILQAYWTLGKWGVNLRETIYGETASLTSFDQTGVGPGTYKETIPVTGITDISIDYKLTPLIKLTAGANNLFDVYPPKTPTGTNMGAAEPVDGDLAYSVPYNFSPFGINGGYYYGRVTVSF